MIKGHTDIDIWNTGFFINADYFSDDFIIHGDDAALQAAAELQVRLSIAEKQHIGGKAAYVHNKHPGRLQQLPALGNHRGVSLGVD